MGITTYCATCGKRSSIMCHRPSGNYYLHQSCLCYPGVIDPWFFPMLFKPQKSIEEMVDLISRRTEDIVRSERIREGGSK